MAYIRVIGPRKASGELREVYDEIGSDLAGGRFAPNALAVWNIMRLFSLRPAYLRAVSRGFVLMMWSGNLRRETKEAIAVAVSATNDCQY
jgi:alkylhydroperoxidase family enzyme